MAKTLRTGLWSDPTVWDTIPNSTSLVEINHGIMLDQNITVAGMNINGSIMLDPNKSISISSSKNIIVNGYLASSPREDVSHMITFTGIKEDNFVGGGDIVLDSDIGLWVMGAGQLYLTGSLTDSWNTGLDPKTQIKDIVARAVNLQRNVIIRGTASGQSHLFIKSGKPQTIKYVMFQYMGPRKDRSGDGIKELVTGRYAVHFHHSEEGSRGSVIEGCLAKDCNNHCYVPHGSHGITMHNNVAINVMETPFWYDFGHKTNDLLWDGNLAANISYAERSLNQDSDDSPTFGAGGFVLGFGDSNTCTNNIVYSTSGSGGDCAAYIWPELRDDTDISKDLTSSWKFQNNIAHSCPIGIFVWQNSEFDHIIEDFELYNCETSIFHGAYANQYNYNRGIIQGGPIELKAASNSTVRLIFQHLVIDVNGGPYCVIADEGPLNGVVPVLFRSCKFLNYTKKAIIDQNPGDGLKNIDVVNCGLAASEYQVSSAAMTGETIRVQEGTKAWQIKKSGTTSIATFHPALWGNGTGLTAEYYTTDFKTLLLKRIEPGINIFDLTHPQIHYAVPASYAVRWTGEITPQFTETYTFICTVGGGIRLWVNNTLLLDSWEEKYPGEVKTKSISLVANTQYDFKVEYFNDDTRSQLLIDWQSTSLKRERIPMAQLTPLGDIVGTTTTTSTTTSTSSTAKPTTSTTTTTSTTRVVTTSTTTTTSTTRATTSTTTTTSTTAGPKVIIEILDNGTWRYK